MDELSERVTRLETWREARIKPTEERNAALQAELEKIRDRSDGLSKRIAENREDAREAASELRAQIRVMRGQALLIAALVPTVLTLVLFTVQLWFDSR